MKIKLYQNITSYEAVKSMLSKIDNSDINKDHVVIVPDRFSLLSEKLLLQIFPQKSLFNVRVRTLTSFSVELLKRFNIEINPEDNLSGGEVLLLTRKAIMNVKDNLTTFKKTKIAFCQEISKIISQLKSSGITSDMLAEDNEKAKYHDLKLIMEEYERLLGDKVDANTRMKLLNDNFTGHELKDTEVYFAGFDAFTKVGYTFIKNLVMAIGQVSISMATPLDHGNEYIYENDIVKKLTALSKEIGAMVEVETDRANFSPQREAVVCGTFSYHQVKCDNEGFYNLYSAQNVTEEIESVAKHIFYLIHKGYRFKDFSIAVSDLQKYQVQIENIFDRYDIPYYIDTSLTADKTLLGKLIFDFFEVLEYGYSGEKLCNLFSNILLGDNSALIDKCQRFRIDNKAKYKLYLEKEFAFADVLAGLDKNNDAKALGGVLLNLLERVEERFNEVLTLLQDKSYLKERNINVQTYEIMRESIELINKYGCDDSGEYQKALKLLLSFVEVSTVPTFVDGVMIGSAAESYFGESKVLYIMGGQALPLTSNDNGLLSDDDLSKCVHEIEPTIKMINRRARFKLFNLLTLAQEGIIITYQSLSEEGKRNGLPTYITSLNDIFSVLPIRASDVFFVKNSNNLELALLSCEKEKSKKNYLFKERDKLSVDAKELFFPDNKIKVTELENYFNCPFGHFVNYGLKLKEFSTEELDQRDIGNICHKNCEIYIKKLMKEDFKSKIDHKKFIEDNFDFILTNLGLDEKLQHLDEKESFFRYIKRQMLANLNDIDRELEKSSFRPKYVEMKFDNYKIQVRDNAFTLIGRADRVDEKDDYFRIIDYKTGNEGNVLKSLFYGEKLQLFLYQKIASETLKKMSAGGYYFNARLDYADDDEDRVILKGIAPSDDKIISYLDKDIEQTGKSTILSIAKAAQGGYKGAGVTKFEFSSLSDYALNVVKEGIEEICDGYIAPKPTSSSCTYCKLRPLCGYEAAQGIRKNDKTKINFKSEEK